MKSYEEILEDVAKSYGYTLGSNDFEFFEDSFGIDFYSACEESEEFIVICSNYLETRFLKEI